MFLYQPHCINIIPPFLHINFIILLISTGLFSKCFIIKIVIKRADQTNKAYKSNYSQNLDSVHSIFMIITQSKLVANDRAVKSQKMENFV